MERRNERNKQRIFGVANALADALLEVEAYS